MPSRRSRRRQEALKELGALHPHPERVHDPLFQDSAFFDPHDLVQVKYEMLRRVRTTATSVSDVAAAFGFSRPAFYQAREALERAGLAGLLPRKRGPRGPHKLTDEILAVLAAKQREDGSAVPARELAAALEEEFGIAAHPRSIERSLARFRARQEKKR
jgi:transposase